MNAIRKILVPVDFSDPSRAAFDYAAEFARPLGATLDVVYVWEAPTFVPPMSLPEAGSAELGLIELVKKNAQKAVDDFVAEAKKRGIAIHEALIEMGPPAHTIVELAKRGGYDLIVIGTHGRTGFSRALIGSVAERVVRHAACPVLAVRSHGAA